MKEKIIKIYNKHKKIINYLFFGVCTTIVNILSYYVLSHVLNLSIMFSTIIAWVLAVLFAYITNRKWVFTSKAKNSKDILLEIFDFFSCRLATGLIDILLMFIFVEKLQFNDVLIKIVANIVVIILNYVLSKLVIFKEKDGKNRVFNRENVYVFLFMMIISFFFLLYSPNHIWVNGQSFTDSSVFKTVSLMMKNGYMPYLDSFDHKGPLIYMINYVADTISFNNGIFYVELLFLSISLFSFYKIARLKCNKLISIFIVFIATALLSTYFEGGNFTEEFALPFIGISTYIFLDYFINSNISKFRLILCGFSFASVLMLRVNMVGLWFAFCIFVLFKKVYNKEYKELLEFLLYFLIGASIIIVPIIIWLLKNNAFGEFYNAYIRFNGEYSSYSDGTPKISSIINTMFSFLEGKLIIFTFIISIFIIKKDKFNALYLVYLIVLIMLISMSGYLYAHYMMIFIPAVIYPFSCLFKLLGDYENQLLKFIVFSYIGVNIVFPVWNDILKNFPSKFYNRNLTYTDQHIKEITNIIVENTDKDDKISVYGNADIVYLKSRRLHATKYSYQFPISEVNKKIQKEYFEQLSKELPKIIIVNPWNNDELINNFLKKYSYKLISTVMQNEKYEWYIYIAK